jgi:hypothetical protein
MKPSWGDTVRLKGNAAPELRGRLAAVCGIRTVENADQVAQFGRAIGTILLLVEFGDGSSTEIPQDLVEI